jgi:hypothetical protein
VTSHQRCIVCLQPDNIDEWLAPLEVPKSRLEAIQTSRFGILRASKGRLMERTVGWDARRGQR